MAAHGLRVNVTNQATALNGSDSGDVHPGKSIVATNRSATALDLGGPNVATGQGFQLDAGDTVSIDLEHGETIYAVGPAAGPYVVHVLRTGVVQ